MIADAATHAPCRVFDANGDEWRDMRWVNTETGEGEQLLRHEGGGFMVTRNTVATAMVYIPAPVRIEPMQREYQS
jgi:hypothetical protein